VSEAEEIEVNVDEFEFHEVDAERVGTSQAAEGLRPPPERARVPRFAWAVDESPPRSDSQAATNSEPAEQLKKPASPLVVAVLDTAIPNTIEVAINLFLSMFDRRCPDNRVSSASRQIAEIWKPIIIERMGSSVSPEMMALVSTLGILGALWHQSDKVAKPKAEDTANKSQSTE